MQQPRHQGDWQRISRWRWERRRVGGTVEVVETSRGERSRKWRVYLANDAGAVLVRHPAGSVPIAEDGKRAAGGLLVY